MASLRLGHRPGIDRLLNQFHPPNLHVSVNGFSFAPKEHLDMVAAIPLDRLQLETDAPWGYINPNGDLAKKYPSPVPLPPSKKKDKFELGLMVKERNESCAIGQVASIVAGLKGITVEEVVEAAWRHSTEMFNLHSSNTQADAGQSKS
ncbi:uncharacterized protein MYCFIDRAFT_84184 [Pseudocercospora fijiensis CIRAD86]|uniref:Uncharacterized protein n=1 Tax=Pseudocercospora fijiensis (strain CIRAD86) TaxID=383855 RepID=N1Q5P3_PSEFD|nr:uncharacterized protein MYCFIDRAFT_84184 [Pseudocercospora fijiensis CIRAD86]EME87239.1 hypothetical protein MYCFIDRAFT_84184 [Pseudocercospora fijiensis CIRAD86]